MAGKGKKKLDQSDYNRQYYEENAERIQQAHKDRYWSDSDYRETQIEQAKARYHADAPARRLRRKIKETIRRHNIAKRPQKTRERQVIANGKMTTVFTVGALVKAIGRTTQTIYAWERRGVLPPPTSRDDAGRRWYSQDYIDKVRQVVLESRDEAWDLEPLKERMREVFGPDAFDGG